MKSILKASAVVGLAFALAPPGCAAQKVDFSKIQRPDRPAALDAYDVFVGSWTWDAEMANADDAHKKWSGEARWEWALDGRWLHGDLSATSGGGTRFASMGLWSWHPTEKEYVWWMFNDWGYPQEGESKYDAANKCWKMHYKAVGLDGTTSHGQYVLTVADQNTLNWTMCEWADPLRTVKKMDMTGTFRRKG